jgi:Uma2 family endonuclease
MKYEEFLEWDGPDQHVEWVDGEIVFMPPISNDHQDLGGWFIAVLRIFVEAFQLGVVRHEPFQMKTGPNLPGRAPDVLFVAKRYLSRIKKNHLEGPADVVIEISPGTRSIDRGDKHYEYEKGGVREYWLIDPERKQAEFYILGRNRIYRAADISEGVFRSAVLKNFWLKVEWLWHRPLPDAASVLHDLGVI